MFSWMHNAACCLAAYSKARVRIGARIRFSVSWVSGYAHVFVLLSVATVAFPLHADGPAMTCTDRSSCRAVTATVCRRFQTIGCSCRRPDIVARTKPVITAVRHDNHSFDTDTLQRFTDTGTRAVRRRRRAAAAAGFVKCSRHVVQQLYVARFL